MKKILYLLSFTCQATFAQEISGEIELGGFLLGQQRTAVHRQLGPPIKKEITDDKWLYEFHLIKPDTSVYTLFKYAAWDTTHIYGIDLDGDYYPEMHPFAGLRLGDQKEKVDHALGLPSHVEKIEDPALTINYYKDKNYSVDIDAAGRLFGINIFGDILDTKPKLLAPSIRFFHNAIVNKNVDSLLHAMAPNVAIHQHGNVYRYSGAAREEFKNADSPFVKALLGEQESILYVFAKERAEGAVDIKADATTKKSIHYYSFFDSSIISEIVFIPMAGKWLVSSIHFRK